MEVARIILTVLLALLLLTTGGGKLAGQASSHQIRDSIAVSPRAWRLIGGVEIVVVVALVAGVWMPVLGVAGALGVIGIMAGAIITRMRAGGPQLRFGATADGVFLALGVVALILSLAAV